MSTSTKLTVAAALSSALVAPVVTSAAPARETVWEIDTGHASAQFKVRHLMVSSVKGELGPVTGTVVLDEGDLTRSRVEVSIDARKIDSRDGKRDEHLRSADFFDVAKHPYVTFKSTKVKKGADGALDVIGDLTIRGVTKSVALKVDALANAVTDPWGNVKRGATARTSLHRKDFGLVWNMALETGGVVVGDKVDVEIEVELLAKKPARS